MLHPTPARALRVRRGSSISGWKFPAVAAKAGLYYVEFHINGKLARRIPLPVVVGSDTQPVKAPARTKRAAKPKTKRPPPPPKKRRR